MYIARSLASLPLFTKLTTLRGLHQSCGVLVDHWVEVDISCVPKAMTLLLKSLCYLRMTMAHRNSGNSSKHIKIFLALMVPQPLHLPLMYEDWLPVVGQHGRGQVLLPYEDYHTGGMYHLPDSPSDGIVRSIIWPAMVTSPTMLHHRSC